MQRLLFLSMVLPLLVQPAGSFIKWVDFQIPYESLEYALEVDIATFQEEQHISWIDALALAGCRTRGKCELSAVKQAVRDLKTGASPQTLLSSLSKYYAYYHDAYSAALGGLVGSYAIEVDGKWVPCYGLKAFSPIAAGFSYSHCADFGAGRTFGFARKHLGNDLMGSLGTPIVAIEGGTVEALGWNRYGGWRVGIRSFDRKRYYYYAHLKKDAPYAPGLKEGDTVQAGDVLGFMGRTGYSDTENTNNIDLVHLHLGLELIFDESQKECDNEIWIDVYNIVRLLHAHRVTLEKEGTSWRRVYPYRDLDRQRLPV